MVPFGKFNGASGPREWANHKVFEAVRPCFSGFSEQARPRRGQKVHTKEWKRGCAKVSSLVRNRYFLANRHGGCSSVGRAPGCGPGGRGFKSLHSPHLSAPVAQLDRAPDFESVGRPFESGRACQ